MANVISRRGLFLGLTAPLAASAAPFPLGVASGDPTGYGFVLWTKVGSGKNVAVDWEVAADEGMRRVLRRGVAQARPEHCCCVHVDVGGLEPGRWYWYRFRASGEQSPIGRTRTAPRAGSQDRWSFGVASCQKWQDGYFTAYEDLARQDLDLVIHTGDYIYEKQSAPGRARHHDLPDAVTLDDYRARYALYRSDPLLQQAHAQFPWVVTWDDHEVWNNYAGLNGSDSAPKGDFSAQRRAAYRAFFEHMPVRRAARQRQQVMRRLTWGGLADVHVLDGRQFRSPQPCGDGNKPPCAEMRAPGRTMLGAAQKRWLFEGLAQSQATWNILAQQVIFAPFDIDPGPGERYSMDKWDGYPEERDAILRFLGEQRAANPKFSPVVLTGDNHNHWAFSLEDRGRRVGFEFAGTSISSGGDGADINEEYGGAVQANPHLLFHSGRRGYLRCFVDPREWRTEYVTLDFVSKPGAQASVAAQIALEAASLRHSKS